jgi:hypothetical protein
MQDEPLWMAMEAYRPGTDDPGDPQFAPLVRQLAADPDLAERFQELRRLDGVIRGAFGEVPVPEGLAQRLLGRLAEARDAASPAADADPPTVLIGRSVPIRRSARPRLMRWAVGLAGAVAAALVVAVLLRNHPPPLTPSAVLEEATRLFAAEPLPKPGFLLANVPAPPDYPLGRDVLEVPGTCWRWVEGFLGGRAVAYDLPGPRGSRATLYVTGRIVDQLPSLPPDVPRSMTAGCAAAAWQQEGVLYVLVVSDARAYRSFLDLSRGPLT